MKYVDFNKFGIGMQIWRAGLLVYAIILLCLFIFDIFSTKIKFLIGIIFLFLSIAFFVTALILTFRK